MPISLFGHKKRATASILEDGWQLFSKPTTLEPVGTLFRIDDKKRRFIVDQLTVTTQTGAEVAARVQQRVTAGMGIFARFLGLDSIGGKLDGKRLETFDFEIVDPIRELATDAVMDKAMAPVLSTLNYRADNRYFVIRETRSATAMRYRLTKTQLGALGGEAAVAAVLGAGVQLGAKNDGLFEIDQTFPERMRVMFLADEIAPVRANLASDTPELGRMPVSTPIEWVEA